MSSWWSYTGCDRSTGAWGRTCSMTINPTEFKESSIEGHEYIPMPGGGIPGGEPPYPGGRLYPGGAVLVSCAPVDLDEITYHRNYTY